MQQATRVCNATGRLARLPRGVVATDRKGPTCHVTARGIITQRYRGKLLASSRALWRGVDDRRNNKNNKGGKSSRNENGGGGGRLNASLQPDPMGVHRSSVDLGWAHVAIKGLNEADADAVMCCLNGVSAGAPPQHTGVAGVHHLEASMMDDGEVVLTQNRMWRLKLPPGSAICITDKGIEIIRLGDSHGLPLHHPLYLSQGRLRRHFTWPAKGAANSNDPPNAAERWYTLMTSATKFHDADKTLELFRSTPWMAFGYKRLPSQSNPKKAGPFRNGGPQGSILVSYLDQFLYNMTGGSDWETMVRTGKRLGRDDFVLINQALESTPLESADKPDRVWIWARVALRAGDVDMAVDVAESFAKSTAGGDASLATAHVRILHPALVGLAMAKDLPRILRLLDLATGAGMVISSPEFVYAAEAIAVNTPPAVVDSLLDRIYTAGGRIPNEAASRFLTYYAAQGEGSGGAAGASGEKGGGLNERDGGSEVGDTRWNVGWTRVSADGAVERLPGHTLRRWDENDRMMVSRLAESVEDTALRCGIEDFDKFKSWLRAHGPFNVVLDGANLGLFNTSGMFKTFGVRPENDRRRMQGQARGEKERDGQQRDRQGGDDGPVLPFAEGVEVVDGFNYEETAKPNVAIQLDRFNWVAISDAIKFVRNEMGGRPLLIMHFSRVLYNARSKFAMTQLEQLMAANELVVTRGDDDLHWLFASLMSGPGTMVVSNDQMRDHARYVGLGEDWSHSDLTYFQKWRARHQIKFRPHPLLRRTVFEPPAYAYDERVQRLDDGTWMIPAENDWVYAQPLQAASGSASARANADTELSPGVVSG